VIQGIRDRARHAPRLGRHVRRQRRACSAARSTIGATVDFK
jgi:hypothetical protein